MTSGFVRVLLTTILGTLLLFSPTTVLAKVRGIEDFTAYPPIHIQKNSLKIPDGLTPSQIKSTYHLPETGGKGTIAIIGAYDSPSLESDLGIFNQQFGLPYCTKSNNCLEIHPMAGNISPGGSWEAEGALDTQWAHAIAPQAKILFVEAKSASGKDLLAAVDYARSRADVVAVSMSWGGGEYSSEGSFDSHFTSNHGVAFFASSGDSGAGVEWPAVSPNVIGVGGTTLHFNTAGRLLSETAWSGSGGGVSSFVDQPSFQQLLNNPKAHGKRSVPDVSFNADPASGFAIYHQGWQVVGGTSAGAPQWAAIRALGTNFSNQNLYSDALNTYKDFRDISKGINGSCGFICHAHKNYDTVTGLGSPLTTNF